MVALLSLVATVHADDALTNATAESVAPPSTIDADTMQFDQSNKTYIADGHVVIHDKESTLQADHVKYDAVTKDAWADGHVRLNQGAQEWVAPSMYYNFDTRALKTAQADGFVDPLFVRTENLHQADTNHYLFARGTAASFTIYDKPGLPFRGHARRGSGPGDPGGTLQRHVAFWECTDFLVPHDRVVIERQHATDHGLRG